MPDTPKYIYDSLIIRLKTHSARLLRLEEMVGEPRVVEAKAGEQGPKGDVGPMPLHRWIDGTKLQFQQGPDGDFWGEAVDLQGPKGKPGQSAGAAGFGGPSAVEQTVSVNSYWPSGW